MSHLEPAGTDLDGVVADANAVAGRPQDRRDLEELKAFHGTLLEDEIPGFEA